MNPKKYKEQLLQSLHEKFIDYPECPLAPLGRKQEVFGDGNSDASLVFIGEAPGAQEDALGKPFVGRAGKLLNKILDALDIKRSEVFITNIVKCRPPGNRKPSPQEMELCCPGLLEKQIKIIQPKIICTLGATALEGLLGLKQVKITKLRGKLMRYGDTPVIPTLHPAYVLRNPKALKDLTQDIQAALSYTEK